MRRVQSRTKLILLALCFLLLSACADDSPSRSVMFIEAVAIDREDDKYRLTMQVFDPLHGGGNIQELTGPVTRLDTSWGETLTEAIHNLSLTNGKRVIYTKNRLIVVSEEIARDGLLQIMDYLLRYSETRSSINIVIAQGKASDIVQATMGGSLMPTTDMLRLLKNAHDSGMNLEVRLLDVMNALLEESTSMMIPAVKAMQLNVKTGEKKAKPSAGEADAAGSGEAAGDDPEQLSTIMELDGVALFRHDRLDAFCPQEEMAGIMWLLGEGAHAEIVTEFGDDRQISAHLISLDMEKSVRIVEGIPSFSYSFQGQLDLTGISPFEMKEHDQEVIDAAKHAIEERFVRQCYATAEALICEGGFDILQWGRWLRIEQPQYWQEHEQAWPELIRQCRLKVECDVNFKRIGRVSSH